MTNFEKLNEDIEALMIGNNSNMKKPKETVSVANPVYANAIEEEEKLKKRTREQMKDIESSDGITPKENGVGKQIKNEYTKQLSLDEGLFGEINEGPGAGYSIESEGYIVDGNVVSFKVIEREPLLVDVEVDMNGTVKDFRAEGAYSGTGEQHDLSIHCDRVIVDLSDIDIEEEQIDNDFLKSFIIDYLADGRGDITYGGGWSHVTYDGTVTEITDGDDSWLNNYVKASISLTDKENIEAVDRLVSGYGYDTFYQVVIDGVGDDYFETESEAIEYAKKHDYDSVRIIYVTELFNGDEEIESGDTIWEKDEDEEDVDESIKNNESENKSKMKFSEMNESLSDEFKDIIGKHFKYSFDFEFLDVVDDILGRIDDFSDQDDITQAIDAGLIYDSDQWKVLKHYCTATEANWDVAFEEFENDIIEIANEIAESQEEDEDEEDVDEGLNEAKEKMVEDLPDTVYELVYDACFPDGVKNYKPILFKGLGNGYDEERFYVKGLNDWDIGVAVENEDDAKFAKGIADTLKLPYEYKETSLLSDGLTGVAIIRMDEKTANIPTDEYLEKIGISGKVRNDPNKRK